MKNDNEAEVWYRENNFGGDTNERNESTQHDISDVETVQLSRMPSLNIDIIWNGLLISNSHLIYYFS